MTTANPKLDQLCVNTIRALAIDTVQEANSGHPGLPLGAAPVGYSLFARAMKHNPANPGWPDRDRFVLSAGHGSALLYSLLHLTGYDLPLDQLKQFRQWGSHTPGHPEYGDTAGRRGHDRPTRPGLRDERGHGDRREPPQRTVQPAGARGREPPHLRARRRRRPHGGRRARSGLARRPPRAGQARRLLRLQPDLPGCLHEHVVHRRRRPGVRRVRLARADRGRRERPRRPGARDRGRQGRRRQAVARDREDARSATAARSRAPSACTARRSTPSR